MSDINPYEAPQENSRLPIAEEQSLQPLRRRSPPLWQAKPPAFALAVLLQGVCLVATIACVMFAPASKRASSPNNILAIAVILLAFAGLLGLGILIVAKRYDMQGWVLGEIFLLMFIVFVLATSSR